MFSDCHVHSNTSIDAVDDIATICQAAIDRGLVRICFTNHYEIFAGNPTPEDFLFNYDLYSDEVERAREKFGDRLEILKGVEFGQPHRHPREFEKILAKDFDMIMASVHSLPLEFGIHWLWVGSEAFQTEIQKYFQQRYYEDMLLMASFGGFDVVAHFDWPKRVYPDFHEDLPICREIFSALKRNGAVLEINASAYDRGCEWFYPSPVILEEYFASGLNRIVVGSDAHIACNLGSYFDRVENFLQGKPCITGYFKQREFFPNEKTIVAPGKDREFFDLASILQDHLWGGAIDTEQIQELIGAR